MSLYGKKEDHRIATVSAALNQLTVAQLKPLAALLRAPNIPTRKPELVALVERQIAGARLRELWKGLDDIQKKAVSETLYAPEGVFNHARFKAKYGRLPNFGGHSRKDASLVALFIYNEQVIPQDLQERLRAFVTPPDPPQLKLTGELPEVVGWYEEDSEGEDFDDDWDEDDEFEDFDEDGDVATEPATRPSGAAKPIPLLRRDTERAAGFDFEVTDDPWSLYITDQQYGSLGYIGSHDWSILQGRYLLCLLFEYAATLGLIDVAYIHPSGARGDFSKMWGTDELQFLSRYDGLLYFRLNPLGAYCLGLTDHYAPSRVETRAALTVLPSLQISVAGVSLSPGEALLLETWAERESGEIWRLDRDKALSAVEGGHQIAELREFLQARDEQPLPETVEGFIVTTERQARALKNTGAALLIECADAELAELIANHERTKKLCLRAGERHLVIKADAEEQFRKAVHLLGYGMPRV
jgi:hypothetical protein